MFNSMTVTTLRKKQYQQVWGWVCNNKQKRLQESHVNLEAQAFCMRYGLASSVRIEEALALQANWMTVVTCSAWVDKFNYPLSAQDIAFIADISAKSIRHFFNILVQKA